MIGPSRSRLASIARLLLCLALCVPAFVGLSRSSAMAANPYGILVNQIDHATPRATIAALMDRAQQAGAGWVRVDFWWYSVEWNRGQWDWRYFDAVVAEATSRGLDVLPVLWGTPRWAATDLVFSYGVPDMAAWETFVGATVSRYKGSIRMWEIWNEPDLTLYWKGTPAKYAELLARAAGRIRAVDPTASVALGGLAQGGPITPNFLESILGDRTYPAGAWFDVHNFHTNFRSMSGIVAQIDWNRGVLASYGLSKPMIVTEASYSSDPRYQPLAGYTGGEDGQARYVTDAYNTMLRNGIAIAVWGSLTDKIGARDYTHNGLVRLDLSAKPAFGAFQQLAEAAVPTSILTPPPMPGGGQ
jgi:hypothetical protein